MREPTPKLYDFVDPADGECVRRETEEILREFFPDYEGVIFRNAFEDVEKLFFGLYPGYRASNTKYHDFEHTCSVVLATVRLIYGALVDGESFAEEECLKGILAALFHDVGLIQTADDTMGTGAKYTVGHEERSIMFMRSILDGVMSRDDQDDIADCIRCTILAMSPSKVAFASENIRTMGYFLGSADLLAQIADRYYLEKLFLLFEEFQEARIPGYDSAMDLLAKTSTFYQEVVRIRLDKEFLRVDRYMELYFSNRRGVDKDLYSEAIDRNLSYLESILSGDIDDLEGVLSRFRRGSIPTYTI
ncbi:HD domain-containing protein [uncultured Pseudodesulfovibrio sp.]|uniref:HD domain-containing protein n=1 Tax=uncultured Pseudodesulfovibrio sp. TaxID=2035858 RepID=UPI0029C7B6CF|nr:HD domain-containing protein [uncultured Pseudodesulfovibrio sp.]